MTTSTVTRKVRSRRSPFAANPTRFCTACLLERSMVEQHDAKLKGMCQDCTDRGAVALVDTPATAEPIPAQRTEEPGTHEGVRVCGNCDANISTLAGAAFCSETCKVETAAVEAKKAAKVNAPKPLPSDVRMTVQWSIREGLSDDQIRVGLNGAWKLRQGQRFTPDAVAAAARVWFEDYNRDTFQRGERNTKVLRVLNAVRRLIEG
ncbi:hypothetical protein [Actinokineospora cianjurensis]|uniref:Uncharacterized protein n=1 Tax=Actinokineospora cianjurensis TaxID=585224 RepID=A0A421B2F6_9PSEU|nr:hypothetical protein [Actinokineospora cianjurensis]RLK58441.1 hypothetical protein CLV68_4545 [Actinokineospora cianjurensis]